MARTSTYICKTCGTKYEFCLKCQVAKPDYDAENFCCAEHDAIYATLSKHGCNLISADEALKELSAYNLDEITLTEGILSHIEKIKSEAGVKVEETIKVENLVVVAEETTPTESTVKSNKNNKKKKW